ncbi:rCG27889, partial [Rattus norvegicus]
MMTGIDDCYISGKGCMTTLGNFAKASYDVISNIYSYLTIFTRSPYQKFTDHLVKTHTSISVHRTQAP